MGENPTSHVSRAGRKPISPKRWIYVLVLSLGITICCQIKVNKTASLFITKSSKLAKALVIVYYYIAF